MHVITFYSYKGGTGRSMALVNIAAELIKSGLRVLIVDFDLEAPGLDTFNLPRPQKVGKGVVEFVLDYLETNQSPDVSNYIYKSPVPGVPGQLWVMPAGRSDGDYDLRFRSINWDELYRQHAGFLLFEDLKAQWAKVLEPDYVLIDSRTGHTDVGGICTRQLPDAVAIFFFPNEQNRRGLQAIVQQIRDESLTARKKKIALHFVMSNVPDVDDELGFVETTVRKLEESLGWTELNVIRHYPSVDLITQSVFTLDRPRTRLAREYQQLTRTLRRDNLSDREAAIEFLEKIAPRSSPVSVSGGEVAERVHQILTTHANDSQILERVALLLRRQRKFEDARSVLDRAAELGTPSNELLAMRAELNYITGNQQDAIADIRRLFERPDAGYGQVNFVVTMLVRFDVPALSELPTAEGFKHLDDDDKWEIAKELFDQRTTLPVAEHILRELLQRAADEDKDGINNDLVLCLIGQGKHEDAKAVISPERPVPSELSIENAFNYAMAEWATNGNPPTDLLMRVVQINETKPVEAANRHQCVALALWATGNDDAALERLGQAWQQIDSTRTREFSAWSYLRRSPRVFMDDLSEMQRLFEGERLMPEFARNQANHHLSGGHQ